jgi:hypothetical protein
MGLDDVLFIAHVINPSACRWARWARFLIVNKCIIVNKIHLHTSHLILWLTGGGNGLGMDI